MDQHGIRVEGMRHVDEHRQRLVVDLHGGGRVGGGLAGLGHHDGNRIADELDLVCTQARPRRLGLEAQVCRGEHAHDTGDRERRRRVDAVDAGVRERRPDERRVQAARDLHVVGEAALAADQPRVFAPADEASQRMPHRHAVTLLRYLHFNG